MFETSNSQKKRASSEHGLTCIAWNDCPFEPAKIAVGGYSKIARVLTLEKNTLREVSHTMYARIRLCLKSHSGHRL